MLWVPPDSSGVRRCRRGSSVAGGSLSLMGGGVVIGDRWWDWCGVCCSWSAGGGGRWSRCRRGRRSALALSPLAVEARGGGAVHRRRLAVRSWWLSVPVVALSSGGGGGGSDPPPSASFHGPTGPAGRESVAHCGGDSACVIDHLFMDSKVRILAYQTLVSMSNNRGL